MLNLKTIRIAPVLILLLMSNSCSHSDKFELQGHRGARGLMPENTIPAFEKALQLGVNTLEMDVVITKDLQVLVSHDPWFSSEFCADANGERIPETDEQKHPIYQMTYAQTQQYDCGSIPHPRFPEQKKMKAHKPLLSEVIAFAESYTAKNNLPPVAYNIEIKSTLEGDAVWHPAIDVFSDLVYEQVKNIPVSLLTIQSFDFRVLEYWHKKYPEVRLAALVEDQGSVKEHLEKLSFLPAVYSPDFALLNPKEVDFLHQKGILVIPWTLNDEEDMKKALDWKVDGIITDYPNKALKFR
jgi:glycerophosphoryl diester phosphodiesterase